MGNIYCWLIDFLGRIIYLFLSFLQMWNMCNISLYRVILLTALSLMKDETKQK